MIDWRFRMSALAPAARMLLLLAIACRIGFAQRSGQVLYESNCAGCHGLDGRGGEHAPNIATVARVQQLTDDDLLRIVRDGIRSAGMPAFGARFSGDQLSAVAAYVQSLQGQQKIAAGPGNAQNGRSIFFGKGGCSECHMAAGQGGFIGRDLSSYAGTHSIQQIREVILNPNSNADPHHTLATVVTKGGQRYTGIIRNEDNSSLQLQGHDGSFYLFEKSSWSSIQREKRSLMPADYGSRLTSSEIDDLISYLMKVAAIQPKQAEDNDEW